MAAGKTRLIRGLAEKLGKAAAILFDDYARYCEWPEDFDQWIAQGGDPSCVRNPRLQQDLELLLDDRPIKHPLDKHVILSSPVILLEDPFGRTRPDITSSDLIANYERPRSIC